MKGSTKARGRRYRLGRRAETAAETRRRIVEATFALHGEQGIADTSMTDIAARAGVSVGTVYHHFPSYADAIAACGAYTAEHAPLPTCAVFDGAASRRERVERLVRALFGHYEKVPALESVRRDRHVDPTLAQFAREESANRRRLVTEAIGPRVTGGLAALAAALVDIDAYRALRREGLAAEVAAGRIAELLNRTLDADTGARRR